MDPALARAHAGHRQPVHPARLQALPELFVVFRRLSDLTIVARTLIVQLQYITDVSSQC